MIVRILCNIVISYVLGLQGGREGSMHFMMTFSYIAYLFCKNNLDKNLSIYTHIYKVIIEAVCLQLM